MLNLLNFLLCFVYFCYINTVRSIFTSALLVWILGLAISAWGDTYGLANGTSVSGDIITFDDIGAKFRLTDGSYTDRISWTKFSQDGLQQLAKDPKIRPLVEPFMEIPRSQRPTPQAVTIQPVKSLDQKLPFQPRESLLSALASSSVGLLALFLIYATNIYAAFEIAVVRSRPKALVMGLAVVLPILGPIIFLALPMTVEAAPVEAPSGEGLAANIQTPDVEVPTPPSPLGEGQVAAAPEGTPKPQSSASQVFPRGQFTFNRRFFETKFPGFFGIVRHGADKDSILQIKTGAGQFVVERITRIAANDVHVEVQLGERRQEVMVPFADVREIQLISRPP